MASNRELMERLIAEHHLRVQRGRLFDLEPAEMWRAARAAGSRASGSVTGRETPELAHPAAGPAMARASGDETAHAAGPAMARPSGDETARLTGPDWDRVEGMMLGLAIGDALGNPSESMLPGKRRERFGEIRDYVGRKAASIPDAEVEKALPSDDTQLAFWTLEQLMADDGHVVPEHLLERFSSQQIFGIGAAVQESLGNWMGRDERWYDCAADSAGNGALMRIAPVLTPHLPRPSRELWADAALAAAVTHNNHTSTSACLAFLAMLWELLVMDEPPPAEWWWRRYVEVARDLEGDVKLVPRGGPALSGQASPDGTPFTGPLWRFVEDYVPRAFQETRSAPNDVAVLRAGDIWHSGAFLLETVPSVLFILMRCADDPEEAIVRAVNDTKDNDTVAAVVGAAVGALHGRRALPGRWVTGLKGRTSYRDDGRVFELLDQARERWGS